MQTMFSAHHIFLDLIILIIFGEVLKFMKLIMQFSLTYHFIPLQHRSQTPSIYRQLMLQISNCSKLRCQIVFNYRWVWPERHRMVISFFCAPAETLPSKDEKYFDKKLSKGYKFFCYFKSWETQKPVVTVRAAESQSAGRIFNLDTLYKEYWVLLRVRATMTVWY
jgi:hypothetical protein